MSIKRIRSELDAIRESLNAPNAAPALSSLHVINARLDRLAVRQPDAIEQPSAAASAEAVTWLQTNYPAVSET